MKRRTKFLIGFLIITIIILIIVLSLNERKNYAFFEVVEPRSTHAFTIKHAGTTHSLSVEPVPQTGYDYPDATISISITNPSGVIILEFNDYEFATFGGEQPGYSVLTEDFTPTTSGEHTLIIEGAYGQNIEEYIIKVEELE